MFLIKVSLQLLFVWTVLAVSYERVAANEPWRVDLNVEANFPDNTSSHVKVDLIYPTDALLDSHAAEDGVGYFFIRPASVSANRPSHVIIRARAFGFEDQIINSGILRFKGEGPSLIASTKFEITFEPKNLPRIANPLTLETNSNDQEAFEISIFNPADNEILMTKLNIETGYWGPAMCKSVLFDDAYDININIEGTTVTGKAGRGDTGNFNYPITGKVQKACDDAWINALVPVNIRIAPRTYVIVRLIIHDTQKIRSELFKQARSLLAVEIEKEVKNSELKRDPQILIQKIATKHFRWVFEITFNDLLSISSG